MGLRQPRHLLDDALHFLLVNQLYFIKLFREGVSPRERDGGGSSGCLTDISGDNTGV